ncbi:MAG: purine-nucleoside phosphorylase [Planctomycetaceae bacterium]|nr:purine-nucleoside phosphorylase [Planctomycetaceae bacterium]
MSHPDVTNFAPVEFGETAAAAVRAIAGLALSDQIHAGVILGSGLGDAVDRLPLDDLRVVEFHQIPEMVLPGIKGHKGRLILGKLGQQRLAFLLGRLHAYEGHSTARLLSGVALLHGLGIRRLVVTNAAGGISPRFSVGDLMVISDHVRYPGCRFVDWAQTVQDASQATAMVPRMPAVAPGVWSQALVKIALEVPSALNIHQGTYAMMPGPMYETPAEIRMMRSLGVDAVGMSTVPESIFAAARGIDVLGVSCITNVAAGLSDQPLCHTEVTATAASIEQRFALWLENLLPALCR